ncbi:MAG TPA: nucleoside diphosphate kinase regulator [Dongiaceae bacterium]|nr:nucleoside diphosphate kinase regulator [Dongiaceae bacterium]
MIARDFDVLPEITVTRRDAARLNNMIQDYAPIISWESVKFLLGELARARVVPTEAIPPTTVTMNSVVEVRDEDTGETRIAALTYPHEQAVYRNSVSILTPLGTALLGLPKEQSMSYVDRDGKPKRIRVMKILHQPETAWRSGRERSRREGAPY